MFRVHLGAHWCDSVCFNREKRKSISAHTHTSEVRGQSDTCDIIVSDNMCLSTDVDDGQEVSRSKLHSRQTFCLLIKMTDACVGMADQIQTLTQLTAICSRCYYSKWHYGGMCGRMCCCWCVCLKSKLGQAGFSIEWVYRPNGNSGSWLR